MTLSELTRDAVLAAISEYDKLGRRAFLDKYGFHEAVSYFLVHEAKFYDSKAVAGAAHGYLPSSAPLTSDQFSGGEGTVQPALEHLGFRVISDGKSVVAEKSTPQEVENERSRREHMWRDLQAAGGPAGVAPSVLRELTIYGGAQGIWVDKKRTGPVTLSGYGVAVGLLHTGTSYDDDLSEDAVLYHYPNTRRPPARDVSEIEATKEAGRLGIPVFVITYPSQGTGVRDVHLGWVENWDDAAKLFLVSFGESRPAIVEEVKDDDVFNLTDDKTGKPQSSTSRPGQKRFKLSAIKRYGAKCVVCGFAHALDAAHIRPKKDRGSDDPRNGLVLCANHHRLFDAGGFSIEPETLKIRCNLVGESLSDIGIPRSDLRHLLRGPHPKAVRWLWDKSRK